MRSPPIGFRLPCSLFSYQPVLLCSFWHSSVYLSHSGNLFPHFPCYHTVNSIRRAATFYQTGYRQLLVQVVESRHPEKGWMGGWMGGWLEWYLCWVLKWSVKCLGGREAAEDHSQSPTDVFLSLTGALLGHWLKRRVSVETSLQLSVSPQHLCPNVILWLVFERHENGSILQYFN